MAGALPRNAGELLRNATRRARVTDDDPGRIGTLDRRRARRMGRRDGRRGVPSLSGTGTTPYVEEVHRRIQTAEHAEGLQLHREYQWLEGELVTAARAVAAYRDEIRARDEAERAGGGTVSAPDGQPGRLPTPHIQIGEHVPAESTRGEKPPAWVQRERRTRQLTSNFDAAKHRLSELASQWLRELELHRSRVRLATSRYEELLHLYRSAVLQRHPEAATLEEQWEFPAYKPTQWWMAEEPAPPSRVAEPEVEELLAWALRRARRHEPPGPG